MKKLSAIVSEYFPEETLIKDTKVLLKTTSKLVTGQEVNGFFNSGNLPIPMVETDKKFYFDTRPIYYSSKPGLSYLDNPIISFRCTLNFKVDCGHQAYYPS